MLKTFPKGGVHPGEFKISAGSPITDLPLPKVVNVPVAQHIGVPATVVVKVGDKVKVGQLIAKSEGFISANIHSPVSGSVVKIDKLPDSSGYKKQTVVIQVEGDKWIEGVDLRPDLVKEFELSPKDIVARVNEAGIVGLGGATFPSHVKLSVPQGKKANWLIVNAVECEPYLTADHALMLEKADEVMVGTAILAKALGVEKSIIGIENNKPDAIALMKEKANSWPGIEIVALKVKYPQGGEKQLIKAVTGREVPSGALPIDVGAVVHNVGTVFAVYEAIQKNKPLVERVVTVTGKEVAKPGNFRVRIGTSFNELIEAAGGIPEDTGKIISGGPMMGKAVNSTDIPVLKGTSGILLMPLEEAFRGEVQNCIRCAKCVAVCPMGLEPFLLMTLSDKTLHERLESDRVLDCVECGSCSYICPSSRPLLDYIRLGKANVNKLIRSRKK